MDILSERFTKFMNIMLKIFLSIIIVAAAFMCFASLYGSSIVGTVVFTAVIIISLICGYKVIKSKMNNRTKVILLLIIAGVIRILWLLNTNNVPNSDFNTMYYEGNRFINGNKDVFKGTSYTARFPHFTMMVLYMALMQYIFPICNLGMMKIVNLFLGLSVSLMLYVMAVQIFKDKKEALYILLLTCVFPPFITYTSVFCSENLAMPFYVASALFFIKCRSRMEKRDLILILSSIMLGIGNLFRMIAGVILIAYTLYICIYFKESIFRKIKSILCIILPYILILAGASTCLQKMDITENPLWRGSEPKITSVLRGTNINSLGMWTAEDAAVAENNIGNYEEIESECKRIIYERLTTTSPVKLSAFYVGKLASQWCIGDFSGSLWTQKDMDDDRIVFKIGMFGLMPFQLIYVGILIMIMYGLFHKNHVELHPELKLFYLIFLGYIGAYLITENQCRYGYIASWIFIIIGAEGFISYSSKKHRLQDILPKRFLMKIK